MFRSKKARGSWPERRRGLTTFRALWPELRLSLIEVQEPPALDWVEPHEDARVSRWAHLAANDHALDRGTA